MHRWRRASSDALNIYLFLCASDEYSVTLDVIFSILSTGKGASPTCFLARSATKRPRVPFYGVPCLQARTGIYS
jgi:hypothetical protein